MNTDSPAPNNCTTPQKTMDHGNALVGFMFLCLGFISLLQREWLAGISWLSLAGSCILMIGSPGIAGGNWKKPRCLVAITLCLTSAALLVVSICSDTHSHPSTRPTTKISNP